MCKNFGVVYLVKARNHLISSNATKFEIQADEVKYISQTGTIQQWIPGNMINKLNKSKVKDPAN